MPFQCAPAPPTPSPSGGTSQRRIGSACSDGALRNVWVSTAVSSMSSWRMRYLSSSRMRGSAKSSRGDLSTPRSRPTTVRPALVSSRAMMLPDQPMPTMTASTAFIRLAMAMPSGKIGDRFRLDRDLLAAVFQRLLGIGGGQAGIADHPPRHLAAIAAVDRVGEETLHRGLQHGLEELLAVDLGEIGLAGFHGLERYLAVGRRQAVELIAIGPLRPRVRVLDAGRKELARRERELIA